jgi:hypothetical protein
VDSLVTELSDAIFKATKRPVTPLVNTHWLFDHTGGNVYFGSAGVTSVAQKNVKKRLSSCCTCRAPVCWTAIIRPRHCQL